MLHAGFDTWDLLLVALAVLLIVGTGKLTPLLVGCACPWEALRQKREEFKRRLEEAARRDRDGLDKWVPPAWRGPKAAAALVVALLLIVVLWMVLGAGGLSGGPFLLGRQ